MQKINMNVRPNIPNPMNIVEYKNVDPMLALDFPFTPEHAAHIRRTDPRPFPCFTVNAVEENRVLGQVGVFRLQMISTGGRGRSLGSFHAPELRGTRDCLCFTR
jgi:hypothetical protein